MEVGKAIHDILSNDGDVSAIVSARIYPVYTPIGKEKPFLLYRIDDNAPSDTKDSGTALDQIQVEIFGFSTTYPQATDLMKKVRTALDRYSGTSASVVIQSVQYLEEEDGFDKEDNCFIIGQLYKFRVKG